MPREMDRGYMPARADPSLSIQNDPIVPWMVHRGHGPGGSLARAVHDVDRDGDGGAVVEVRTKGFRIDLSRAQWIKSTRSGPNGDNCVEVAFVDEAIAVRDSQNPTGPALIFTAAEWDAFVGGAKDGEFDL
jgi:hypothetical protein